MNIKDSLNFEQMFHLPVHPIFHIFLIILEDAEIAHLKIFMPIYISLILLGHPI